MSRTEDISSIAARHSNMLGLEGISLHFIWKADYESVAERGLLCHLLQTRLRIARGRPYKAQQQLGTDLISIWDPWSFLRRHWRNCPLGSDNKPWEIIDLVLEEYFADPVDKPAGSPQSLVRWRLSKLYLCRSPSPASVY